MKYTVLYMPQVFRHVDQIWRESEDQESVAEEIEDVNRMLAHDPSSLGESREDGRRITFSQNLGVKFRVVDSESTVLVVAIWRIR